MGQTGEPVPGTPNYLYEAFGDKSEVWTYTLARPGTPLADTYTLDVTGSKHGAAVWHIMMSRDFTGLVPMLGWPASPVLVADVLEQTGIRMQGCVDIIYLSAAVSAI